MPPDSALPDAIVALVPALLRQAGAALVVKDATGAWRHADATMLGWLGRSAQEVSGLQDADLFDAASAAALRAADLAALAQESADESDFRCAVAGVPREFGILRQRIALPDGQAGLALVWRDLAPQRRRDAQLRAALEQIEQLQREIDQMRRDAKDHGLRDNASGLYSRAHFEDQLRREVDLSTREHREFALVSIMVDPPAPDVASLGEGARDRVFEALGRLLRSNTRAMDASCRYEGARFAVLLSGVGLATAHSRMEGLRRQCATQVVVHGGRDIGFTVSMGVASFPHTAHSQEDLVAASQAALEEACTRGGNRVTLASIRFEGG
ncbi:MAG TPA: diguanylate cyclase [Burkholderiaceae bacterium]|nr:diguanylate cyclase [Burkholderiaceae bacterium]